MNEQFIGKLLELAAKYDITDELDWGEDLNFYIRCNDVFAWGCSDAEDISEEDLPLLEQSLKDSEMHGTLLFCARKRKCRPQGAYYQYFDKDTEWELFNACGEEREVGLGNPYSPEDAYNKRGVKEKTEERPSHLTALVVSVVSFILMWVGLVAWELFKNLSGS